jgi:ubiquinone/menaquinone biosynthesis C-methylase UbiE
MAEFHFVEDYESVIRSLIASYPIDEAMSIAVGGLSVAHYQQFGAIERAVLQYAGLKNGMSLIDLGCGSGRLASALSGRMKIDYLGIDIIQELPTYAQSKSDEGYRFVVNRALNIPSSDSSADMVSAFSIFTHLLHAETYLYLEDIKRVLRPGGHVVFSFLEFAEAGHWYVFVATVDAKRTNKMPLLNQFIERDTIDTWCEHLGYEREAFISAGDAPWHSEPPLGQAIALLRKPFA